MAAGRLVKWNVMLHNPSSTPFLCQSRRANTTDRAYSTMFLSYPYTDQLDEVEENLADSYSSLRELYLT